MTLQHGPVAANRGRYTIPYIAIGVHTYLPCHPAARPGLPQLSADPRALNEGRRLPLPADVHSPGLRAGLKDTEEPWWGQMLEEIQPLHRPRLPSISNWCLQTSVAHWQWGQGA